jgi:putative transposase
MVDWPHAPPHRFRELESIYFITASTRHRQHLYRSPADLDRLAETLFRAANLRECALQAWALLSNHYHLVLSGRGGDVRQMLDDIATGEGMACNRRDDTPGRQLWFQYRDTELTFERSWLARLRYTHENAVHHGLVTDARRYRWCSAAWFESNARPSFVKVVRSFNIDRVNVPDDYTVEFEE